MGAKGHANPRQDTWRLRHCRHLRHGVWECPRGVLDRIRDVYRLVLDGREGGLPLDHARAADVHAEVPDTGYFCPVKRYVV